MNSAHKLAIEPLIFATCSPADPGTQDHCGNAAGAIDRTAVKAKREMHSTPRLIQEVRGRKITRQARKGWPSSEIRTAPPASTRISDRSPIHGGKGRTR